jgi:hypothetical protein
MKRLTEGDIYYHPEFDELCCVWVAIDEYTIWERWPYGARDVKEMVYIGKL